MKGKVIVSDYVGSTTGYEIKTDKGELFKVNVLGLEPYSIGRDVTLYFNPDSLLILDKE
jgi:hypothetical protein